MEYFPEHSCLLWQWGTFQELKKMLFSHTFTKCWNVFSCRGDLTLSRWLAFLWAVISCQSVFIVEQNCNKSPPVSAPPTPAGELHTKWWSYLNGYTSHIGNESPLSLSEVYAAIALSWANYLACASVFLMHLKDFLNCSQMGCPWGKRQEIVFSQ